MNNKIDKIEHNCSTKDLIIGGGLLIGACIIGYKTGVAITDYKYGRGLKIMFKANPQFKEVFWETIAKCYIKR